MKTLLMLGDSLVDWGDWDKFLPEIKAINRGMAGEITEGLAARLIDELSEYASADAVLIQSGTNNVLLGYAHFPAIFSTMIPTIRNFMEHAPIIINSLMPMPIVPKEKLAELNGQLAEVASQNENCYFLDITKPFIERCLPITHPGFLNDQVHLSTRGYQVWADEINAFMADHFL